MIQTRSPRWIGRYMYERSYISFEEYSHWRWRIEASSPSYDWWDEVMEGYFEAMTEDSE